MKGLLRKDLYLMIKYCRLFFILIIAFVTSTKSYAFNVAKHISNVNGLTNNSVNCIL